MAGFMLPVTINSTVPSEIVSEIHSVHINFAPKNTGRTAGRIEAVNHTKGI